MCRIVCCAVLRLQLQVHRTSFFIFVPPCRSRGLPQRGDVGHVMEVSGVKASFEDAEDNEDAAITESSCAKTREINALAESIERLRGREGIEGSGLT